MCLAMKPIPVPDAVDGVVLYDGVCVLCSAAFRFVVRRDPAARFRFTPVQGAYGRWLAHRVGIDPDAPRSVAVVIAGQAFVGADAALVILRHLPGWAPWARLLLAVPRPLRTWLYDRIARHRYRLFGRTEACLVPGPGLARHCLPPATPHG